MRPQPVASWKNRSVLGQGVARCSASAQAQLGRAVEGLSVGKRRHACISAGHSGGAIWREHSGGAIGREHSGGAIGREHSGGAIGRGIPAGAFRGGQSGKMSKRCPGIADPRAPPHFDDSGSTRCQLKCFL